MNLELTIEMEVSGTHQLGMRPSRITQKSSSRYPKSCLIYLFKPLPVPNSPCCQPTYYN